jgi:hypothetical protein
MSAPFFQFRSYLSGFGVPRTCVLGGSIALSKSCLNIAVANQR